jgi:hypothetical protein
MSHIHRHRKTFDIIGDTVHFDCRKAQEISFETSNTKDLHLKFNLIQLNKKWRMNIETETLSFEKYNTETKEYDKKFVLE